MNKTNANGTLREDVVQTVVLIIVLVVIALFNVIQ